MGSELNLLGIAGACGQPGVSGQYFLTGFLSLKVSRWPYSRYTVITMLE